MVGRQLIDWGPGERAVNGDGRRPNLSIREGVLMDQSKAFSLNSGELVGRAVQRRC